MMESPEILIVGAGAIGVYYGGRLSQAGAKVSVVARSDFDELSRNGGSYFIKSPKGDFTFKPERVLRSASETPVKPDYVLVSLKVLPGVDSSSLCREAVGPDTAIVAIQNGIGNEEPLAKAFPENEVIGAITYIGVCRPGPCQVLHLDFGRIDMGKYPPGPSEKASALTALFNKAGVDCTVVADIVLKRWSKLLWNAPFNPISVLGVHADTRSIMSVPEAVLLAEKVMEEVAAIAKAEGYELPRSAIDTNLRITREMNPYKSSMLQDFEAGRPIEADALLGVPLQVARRHGVPAPYMETLYALLKLASKSRY